MAIINRGFETLSCIGTKRTSLQDLAEKADAMTVNWIDEVNVGPMTLNIDDDNITVGDGRQNITDYAFSQMCGKVGVPASYITKCLKNGKTNLAIENYEEWAKTPELQDDKFLIRNYDGVVHAVLTDRYNVFDHSTVLHGLIDAMNDPELQGRYIPNEAFMSPDRLHIRFVNFDDPIVVGDEKLNSGFTISTNNVGSGALVIKYFLYRFVCKNGMVRSTNGGVLFRQTHLSSFEESAPDFFGQIVAKVQKLDQRAQLEIAAAMGQQLNALQFDTLLSKAQHELHFGKKGKEKLMLLTDTTYDRSVWGVANAITEMAQQYTLQSRIDMETWAGNIVSGAMAA